MPKESQDYQTRSTDLAKHRRNGSVLKPPFRQLVGLTPSSWKDDRLPEMLWAVLLIGNLKREEALDIFRKVATFVREQPELFDVTQSGIAKWPKVKRFEFITLLKDSHRDAQRILQSLVIFSALPGSAEWIEVLGNPVNEAQVGNFLVNGVKVTLWHQSQEATDCRWIKFLCGIHSGKLKFFNSIEGIEETLRGVFEYPNYGDLKHIRPFIRSSEIAMNMSNDDEEGEKNKWSEKFWKTCLQSTMCSPFSREKQREDNIRVSHDQIKRIRYLLLLHYMKTDESTNIEPRHDSIFGIGFYILRLLDEIVATNLSRGAIGRIVLRSFAECYITLAYLIAKDVPVLWDDFRNYGIGQMKLSYLKARDSKDKPSFIDEEFLKEITNEDRSEEFSDIELSHWASSDLRKMSEEINCKDFYDAYYSWTSSFSHGNWGSIRESNFAMCANPLHRLHLIPSVTIYPLPGILEDVVKVTNLILRLIESQYPGLNCQITNDPKPPKIPWYKEIYYRFRYHKIQDFLDSITKGR